MKNKIALTVMALGLTLPAIHLNAQDGARGPRGPRGEGNRPPGPPVVASLDLNHDGVIGKDEIAAASQSLRALDKNGDGQISADELRPQRGPRPGQGGEQPQDRPRRRNEAAGQDGERGQRPGRPPGPPIMAALDANKDGVLDSSEIGNASAALKTLDKNSDGELTREEIRPGGPRRGEGDRPAGRPRGPRPNANQE